MAELLGFIVRRVIASIIVIFLIVTIVFFLSHASPTDPIRQVLGKYATPRNLKIYRKEYGLNLPLWQQYFNYLSGLLHGNLGYAEEAQYLGTPVWTIISEYAPTSLKLGGYSLILGLLVGIPVGLVSALRQNSIVDHAGQGLMMLFYVIPTFVFVPVAQIIFGVQLHLLPVLGWGDSGWLGGGIIPNAGATLNEMILPVTIFAAGLAGYFAKSFRSFMLEVMRQDYIRTARAKGLKHRVVIYLHAMKNTLIPLVSIVGPTIAFLITGAFIIEVLFSIPGIGGLTVTSVENSDYSLIEGTTLILVVMVVLVNMLTDILYAAIDPRIRL